jgi:hypothetical protein
MLLLLLVEEPYSFLIGFASGALNTIPAPEPESPCPKTTLVIPAKAGTPPIYCHAGLTRHPIILTRFSLSQSLKYETFILEDIVRVSESLREYFLLLEENTKQKM